MSKSNALENAWLLLLFNGTTFADIAENDTTSPATNFYISLHTADPGEAGSQTTNETSYTGYARVAVARTSGGWTVTGNSVSPVADVTFGECTAGTATITHFGVGTASSGTGVLLYKGTLTPNISVSTGIIPRVRNTSTITED